MSNRDLIQGDLAAAEEHLRAALEEVETLRDATAARQIQGCLALIEVVSSRIWSRGEEAQGGQK